jgi:GT2 family glycosyltransferase
MDDDARRLELSPSLRQLCHPDLDPLFWLPERRGAFSAWWGHVPFAHWVMRATQPRVMVELGTHWGVSYAAFCQAVVRCRLNTRCFAVDTWKGDAHASFYEEGVYEDFRAFHDQRYASFSTLLRCTFDEALERIEDGSIDLLHLDGLHTYDAVRHDFHSWLPKFSARGVALLHDINVNRDDFGVWQLWQELREQHPHFEFHHCYGLGVLALGKEPPDAIIELCALNDREEGAALRSRVALIGDHWIAEARENDLRVQLKGQQEAYGRTEAMLRETGTALSEATATRAHAEAARARAEAALAQAEGQMRAQRAHLEEALANTERKLSEANAEAELRRASVNELQSQNAALVFQNVALQKDLAGLQQDRAHQRSVGEKQGQLLREQQLAIDRLQAIEASTTWRATSRLRAVAGRLPSPIRRHLRRAAKAGYWALTPHKMPARLRFLRERQRAGNVSAASPAAHPNNTAAEYANWIKQYDTITDDDRGAIKEAIGRLVDPPLISVVMPVYETPERYLRAAIDSVRTQLYPNWELCVADDASKSPHVRRVLEQYRAAEPRIKICYRSENGHISEASNSALALAEGEFVALLDHDDQLPEHALYMVAAALAENPELDLIFSDEDKIDTKGKRYDPYFKSDWNPDLMLSQNMFSHLGVYRRSLLDAIGGFRRGYEGSQDYDLVLRASARTKPKRIHHIPHILYHWRAIPGSVALRGEEKSYAAENARRAIVDHLEQKSIAATVTASAVPHNHRVRYPVPSPAPLVSLIIPTTGRLDILRTCISGILERTDYEPLELIIVPNNTGERQEVFGYLEGLTRDPRVRIVPDPRSGFNFSRVCNIGIAQAKGELIGLINDDLEVIDPGWLNEMVSHAVRPGIGAVGALLRYPTGHIQHAGVIVGLGGVAGHAFLNRPRGDLGYFDRVALLQNVSAITGACIMMPMSVYQEVGALDEQDLPVAFNDIDLCLRIRERGYRIVWTPYAELYHHESVTRGSDLEPGKIERFHSEMHRMKRRWGAMLQNDPYYNPNLRLDPPEYRLAFPPRVAKPWRRTESVASPQRRDVAGARRRRSAIAVVLRGDNGS